MKKAVFLFLGITAVLSPAIQAGAFTASTAGMASLRYQTGSDLQVLNPSVEDPDAGFAAAYLMPEVDLSQDDRFRAVIGLYLGELSLRTSSPDSTSLYGVESTKDYFNDTYFIRKAYVSYSPYEGITLYAGKRHLIAGSPLIFDNYQPAITLEYDMTDTADVPITFEQNLVKIEPYKLYDTSTSSLFYEAGLTYTFSFFEYLTAFYANLHDTDSELAPLMNQLIYNAFFSRAGFQRLTARYGIQRAVQIEACLQEEYNDNGPIRSSRSSINWFGFTGDRYFGPVELNMTGILETGRSDISGIDCLEPVARSPFDRSFGTKGYLADAKLKYHIGNKAAVGVFFNLSSGDATPLEAVLTHGTLDSFLSVFPYNTETNLFFNGGINQDLNTGAISSAGRHGFGVVAYGGIIDLYPVRTVELKITPALFYPEITDGNYGFETDVTITYSPVRHVSFPFEYDYFNTGDYFGSSASTSLSQVLGGADIVW